jgi:hypothetical protein
MEAGRHSQVLYSMFPFCDTPAAASQVAERTVEAIDPLSVWGVGDQSFLQCSKTAQSFITKRFRWRTFHQALV